MATKATHTGTGIVVTTEKRGVFFGYGEPGLENTKKITQARMCVYWDTTVHGVVGLAAIGPSKACRVTPAAPEIDLADVTAVMVCTPEAVKAWELGPWER